MSQQAPSNWHLMQGCFTFCSFSVVPLHNHYNPQPCTKCRKMTSSFYPCWYFAYTFVSVCKINCPIIGPSCVSYIVFSLYGINLVFILVCILTDSSWRLSHSACFYTSTNGAKLTTSLLFCCWWHCWVSVLHWSNQFPTKLLSCLLGYIVTFQIFKWNQSCRSLSPLFAYLLCVLLAHRLSYGLDSEGCVRHVGSHHRRHHAA